ncbi:MAG: hypothetical protein P8L37_00780 [Phycisphaerales bacterium]|nr:hypothetical protein [Phycisphaerales bacterium]
MPIRCLLTTLCLCSLVAGGCNSTSRGIRTEGGVITDWTYAPESIRIHPLSRVKFNEAGDQARVEARIEMRDRDGFSTRGLGDLTLFLSGSSDMGSHTQVEWQCDLSTVDMNGKQYDCVTRTYLAHLELLQSNDIPLEPMLRARLTMPDGSVLSDRKPIRITTAGSKSEPLDD